MNEIEMFWERICKAENDYELYIVHGSQHGSLIINAESDVVAIVAHNGELRILDETEFKDVNRGAVVSRKFEL